MRKIFIVVLLAGLAIFYWGKKQQCQTQALRNNRSELERVFVGMDKSKVIGIFGIGQERTYRKDADKTWVTFNAPKEGMVTFLFEKDKLVQWQINDRAQVVEEYLSEFAPAEVLKDYKNIKDAIRNVLLRLPEDVFIQVTERSFPVIFAEYYYKGQSRLANSTSFWNLPDDPPALTKGFYLIKLNVELNQVKDSSYIEAIIAHEIAHFVLGHASGEYNIEMEKQANALIKEWGFEKEFIKAKKRW
ncbi:MAG: hypothetical protein MUF05_01150 [Candidatus Omnitrophica bacterium]|jgi:hypothetical protein|nr:hypothetical protein [Candidatus Omnitrophota bacterium]